jgi:hypothetical protein
MSQVTGNRDDKFKKGAVKPKAFPPLVGTHFFLACGWVQASLDEGTVDDTLARIYGIFVDNYSRKCRSQSEQVHSSDRKIRRNAIRAQVKGDFMQSNRASLIAYLIERNTPLETHRIEYHLNRKYAEAVNPRDVYAALFKEYVNP